MIRIFEQGHEDFSSMGLGEIRPLSCIVHEEQGAVYDLELEMMMDDATQYDRLMNGRVIQAPVPAITTPLIRTLDVTVTEYWKTNASAKIYSQKSDVLGTYESYTVPAEYEPTYVGTAFVMVHEAYTAERWVPNGNRVIATLAANKKVTVLNKSDATWWRVTSAAGKTGYIKKEKLTFFEQYNTTPGDEIQARQVRDQLFRIYRVEKDTGSLKVRAWARHIYYDLLGVALKSCSLPSLNVTAALFAVDEAASPNNHGFEFITNSAKVLKKVDYSHRCLIEAQLNPDDGILAKANLRLIRDNYDVFFLKRTNKKRTPITYAQNLKGVTIDINSDSIVNRIIPVGKKADGTPLYKNTTNPHVNSPRNTTSTQIRCKAIEYDVEVSDDMTTSEAQQELVALAEAEFEKGCDLPEISVTVDFLQLGDTEEYAAFRELDRLYMSDIVRIVDLLHGVDIEAEVTEYDFDCLTERYTKIGVGVTSAKRTIGSVGSYMLPNGAISGTKLAMGSVNGSRIEALSVKSAQIGLAAIQTAHIEDATITSAKIGNAQIDTAHIKEATIADLNAGAVTAIEGEFEKITAGTLTSGSIFAGIVDAVKARIGTLIAENLTTDELYARIATIAVAQITAANIETANITWADIEDLTAAIASIVQAEIGIADIDWAHIKDLVTGTAIIAQGVAGELYIARLAVTEANMVSLTVGELIVRGEGGIFYTVSVDSAGNIVTTPKTIVNDELSDVVVNENDEIIYGGITASKLNAQDIFAENAIIANLIAANLDVDELWAREGFIENLKVVNLLTNSTINIINEAVAGLVSAAEATDKYIKLGNMLNSDNEASFGVAIGQGLKLDQNGNIEQSSMSVQILPDRQTFYQNGVVGMELRNNGIQAAQGSFDDVTLNHKWKQIVDASGAFAIMWIG